MNQQGEHTRLLVDEKEEKMVRLDVTEILNVNKMLLENKDRKFKFFDKSMLMPCPELNFLTDHLLNGTMIQVGRDI